MVAKTVLFCIELYIYRYHRCTVRKHNDIVMMFPKRECSVVDAIVVVDTSQTHGEKDKRLSEPCIVNSDDDDDCI